MHHTSSSSKSSSLPYPLVAGVAMKNGDLRSSSTKRRRGSLKYSTLYFSTCHQKFCFYLFLCAFALKLILWLLDVIGTSSSLYSQLQISPRFECYTYTFGRVSSHFLPWLTLFPVVFFFFSFLTTRAPRSSTTVGIGKIWRVVRSLFMFISNSSVHPTQFPHVWTGVFDGSIEQN